MKLFTVYTALSVPLFFSSVIARYGLSPDSIPLLTRTVDYTFHTICNDFQNPVPEPMFDERELASTILAFSSDLYTFLLGYSVSKQTTTTEPNKPGTALLEDLIDEVIDSNRRSDLLESQTPLVKGPIGAKLGRGNDPATHHSYKPDEKFDCAKFQIDVFEFSQSFINMTYAISEKCYRQCTPSGYYKYGSVSYALNRLQTAYERHYAGSFYAQIREIEAETSCYFDDTFMVEAERSVDYAKVWVDTFQRRRTPCAGLT